MLAQAARESPYPMVKARGIQLIEVAMISEMLYDDIMEVNTMELVRKQTYITPAQDRAVKRLAQQQGTTEADILRKALDVFGGPGGHYRN